MTPDNLFSSIEKQNILIIGDVMLDAYLFGKVDRISPEAPVPVVSVVKRDNRPGGAANVAINIRSLGATPYLCSVIGDDDKAELFMKLLEQHELPSLGIIKDSTRPTTTKFRIIGNNIQMLRVDEECTEVISEEMTRLLVDKIETILQNVHIDCIIFQDYDKGVITPSLVESVVSLAKEEHIPIAVDPKKRNFRAYQNVTLFKPNLKEFSESVQMEEFLTNPERTNETMKSFLNDMNIENIMVTLGEKGIITYSRYLTSGIHIPAHLRQISDVSGAGDTVISVAALCIGAGLTIEAATALSNLAGGLVCQYVGVVPVQKSEFHGEIIRLGILESAKK